MENEPMESVYWDDMSGVPLDPDEVRRARAEELETFREKDAWDIVEKEKVKAKGTGIVVGTRWVDANKGDTQNPERHGSHRGQQFSKNGGAPVSYTHLTLPTSDLV